MSGINLLTTLVTLPIDRLGDMNPQLLREWKGRLKRFPVITAIALSVLCQIVIMIGFWSQLPGPVQLTDLRLSTYPRITWRSETQLSPEPLEKLLTLDMINRDRVAQVGIVVERVTLADPVLGDKSLGLNALNIAVDPDSPGHDAHNPIRSGDRLIKIDGQLITPSGDQLTGNDWEYKIPNLAGEADRRIVKHPNDRLTPQRQKLVGTTVELELYSAQRGYYTVTLPRVAVANKSNQYCLSNVDDDMKILDKSTIYARTCSVTPDKQSYQVNWPQWYSDIYLCLSFVMVFPLMGGGVFMLANNLADEKRRGTLNFLQLSPRSAFTILSGKLLGVPICLYLAIGLLLPLRWLTGLNAGYNVGHLLALDLTLISQTLIFYLATLLLSLSVSHPMILALQPWLLAAGTIGFHWITLTYIVSGYLMNNTESNVLLWSMLFSPFSSLAYFNFDHATVASRLNLALGNFRLNFIEYVTLVLLHAAGWCALMKHSLERRFNNSDVTLLQRRFSYPLTLSFVALMIGLTGTRLKSNDAGFHLLLITLLSLIYCLALAVALSPARQTLKDWTRFRHAKPRHERLSLSKDLLLGDTSSPMVAIALNLLLLTSLVLLTFSSHYDEWFSNRVDALTFVCCIFMFIGSIIFATLVSQTFLMLPRRKNWIWLGAVGSTSCLAFPSLSLMMSYFVYATSFDLTHIVGIPAQLSVFVFPLSLMGTLTTILGIIHTRQLIRSGRSESQQLLSSAGT